MTKPSNFVWSFQYAADESWATPFNEYISSGRGYEPVHSIWPLRGRSVLWVSLFPWWDEENSELLMLVKASIEATPVRIRAASPPRIVAYEDSLGYTS